MFREWEQLRGLHAETARAVVVAAGRADGSCVVGTQGKILLVDDLLSTLAVEATIHHLDLTAQLSGVRGPGEAGLREARGVVEGVAGDQFPADWADRRVVLVGTGRAEPTVAERAALGQLASRLPVFA